MKFLASFLIVVIFVVLSQKVDAGGQSIAGQIDRCLQPFSEGTADASVQRYYFDLPTRSCLSFTYKGGYALNLFRDEQTCLTVCAKYL
ncbi:hypothetical protein PVAND_017329 [Polypedilum vanderplanki]|uniref:BPTI/Kunitz inhibitor domain-containing protein n=1 Tax=Polypedilum vanderplanki TaxID=319348 RepID=A0A9J6BIA3_POLVA|nr:hypothetical protein PVAND_017329 [Polypedilum vanderplanki]